MNNLHFEVCMSACPTESEFKNQACLNTCQPVAVPANRLIGIGWLFAFGSCRCSKHVQG